MENGSKALLIAGGMLLAIMVISLIVVTYNSITEYEQTKSDVMTEEQIAKFNQQYEAYNRDVTGYELVSLINKIVDYNALNTVSSDNNDYENNNTDKAYTEMYIKFEISDNEIKNQLYTKGTYDSQKKSDKNDLEKIRKSMQNLESTYGTAVMTKLSGMGSDYDPDDPNKVDDIKFALGRKQNDPIGNLPTIEDVEKYSYYIKFKNAKFKCEGTDYDKKSGRIIKLTYIQK